MELVGDGVKLVGEDEVVGPTAAARSTGQVEQGQPGLRRRRSRKSMPRLPRELPVYAELRNCIDLAIAAAFIQQQDYYGKAGWKMATFADERAVPVETLNTPARVETVVAAVWKGAQLMTPIGGGVTMQPTKALAVRQHCCPTRTATIGELREAIDLKDLAAGQWWWD